jgi:large subunit ribosomal protein L4
MVDVKQYKADGTESGTYSFDESLFGDKIRWKLLRQVVVQYEQVRRRGTRGAKTRGQVKGTSKKPWRQKGTGRARVGTRQSPIWRKGGVVFGPKPYEYNHSIPQKMRRAAMDSAVLGKLKDNEISVVEDFGLDAPKTKQALTALTGAGHTKSTLVVVDTHDRVLWLSLRNIPHVSLMTVSELNAYDWLRHQNVVFTKAGADALQESRKTAAGAGA